MVFCLMSVVGACGESSAEPPSEESAGGAGGASLIDPEGPNEAHCSEPWSVEDFCGPDACPATPAEAEASIASHNCGIQTIRRSGCGSVDIQVYGGWWSRRYVFAGDPPELSFAESGNDQRHGACNRHIYQGGTEPEPCADADQCQVCGSDGDATCPPL